MSAWDDYVAKLSSTRPWDLFKDDAPRASTEQVQERLKVCGGCPRFIKASSQCKECGCFMRLKAKLEDAKCPIHKW